MTLRHMHRRGPALALGALLAVAMVPPAAAQDMAEGDACENGWAEAEHRDDIAPEAVAVLSADETWVAGGSLLGGGRRQAAVLRRVERGWELELPPAPEERDSGFMGIAAAGPDARLWAVGFAREPDYVAAITAVRDEAGWRLTDVIRPGHSNATLSSVSADREQGVWAAGFVQGPPGEQRPWVLHRRDGGWDGTQPPLAQGERATLAGISADADGGIWAVGTAIAGQLVQPYIVQRDRDGWVRHELGLGGAALADVDVPAAVDGWAVGHRIVGADIEPLVLHWDGTTWSELPGPVPGPGPTLLSSVAVEAGTLSVGGTTWDPERRRYRAFAASDDGSGWVVSLARPGWGSGSITDVGGDPASGSWAVGRLDEGFVAHTCDADAVVITPVDAASAPQAAVPAAPSDASPPRPLEGRVRAVDVAGAAGLPTASQSWGAVAADFDGDGLDDIFLGRHGARARLYLNRGGTFVESGQRFGAGDRHGCAAADVDGSGLPDLYCSFGASRGTGIKANQLWLDPGGPEPLLHQTAGGATEPLGRGRQARFLDIDEDGDLDLLLGQETKRMDGLPSLNQAYLETAPATFEAAPVPGIDSGLAAESLDVTDVDGDGRPDVLLVYRDLRAAEPKAGIRLYRNDEGTAFTDVTDATGIESIGERDAALADMDGDGRADLLQLSEDRIVIALGRGGRFERVFERGVSGGTALATGDADGDGDIDVYVLQGRSSGRTHDLILRNGGDGRDFDAVDVPDVRGGSEDDVIALDYDADGRTDFLALNAHNSERGPVQLITLRPA